MHGRISVVERTLLYNCRLPRICRALFNQHAMGQARLRHSDTSTLSCRCQCRSTTKKAMTMIRKVLLAGLLTVSWSTTACTGSDGGVPSPTSAGSSSGSVDRDPVSLPEPSAPTTTSCDATQAQFAIGNAASDELLERARVAAQAGLARFLRPNEPITMEFLASRLNLNLTERGIVESTYCG